MGNLDIFAIAGLAIKWWPVIKAALALVGTLQDQGHADPISGATDIIRSAHGMTPQDEQAWFDRASGIDSRTGQPLSGL